MISKEEILVLHDIITSDSDTEILNEGLLDSATASAFASFNGREFFPSPEQKIARVAYGIIKNHPFADGNKRTGIMFLIISFGRERIPCKFSHKELIDFGQNIANGSMSQEDFISKIMKNCEKPIANENYTSKKVSFEDICEMPEDACVVPGVGGDIEDWKLGLTNSFGLKNPTFIECSGADMNNKFALKGNSAYPADYKFLIIPIKAYEKPRVMKVMKDYDCRWLSDFNQ